MNTDCVSTTVLRIGSLIDSIVGERDIVDRLHSANPTVFEVYFWNIEFTSEIIKALQELIYGDERRFTIKILSCRGPIGDVVSSLVQTKTLKTADDVEGAVDTLVLNGPILDGSIISALKGQLNLKRLRLLGIRSIADLDDNETIIDIGRCTEVDLTHSGRCFCRSLKESLATSQHLEILNLDFCDLSDQDLCRILQVCPQTTLRELHLSRNNCGNEAVTILVHRFLEHSTSPLSVLNLSCQGGTIAAARRSNKTTALTDGRESIFWQPLFEALKHPRCLDLKALDISRNPLTESEVSALAESLKINTTLSSLSLHDCQLSIESRKLLASNISHWNESLKTVDLSGSSNFVATAQQRLINGLKQNYFIESIGNLSYLPYTNKIEYYLDCNLSGRRLLKHQQQPLATLDGSAADITTAQSNHKDADGNATTVPVPLGLRPQILSQIKHRIPMLYSSQSQEQRNEDSISNKKTTRLGRRESTLYYFLRHNPILVER